jgi:hypothetical protein
MELHHAIPCLQERPKQQRSALGLSLRVRLNASHEHKTDSTTRLRTLRWRGAVWSGAECSVLDSRASILLSNIRGQCENFISLMLHTRSYTLQWLILLDSLTTLNSKHRPFDLLLPFNTRKEGEGSWQTARHIVTAGRSSIQISRTNR